MRKGIVSLLLISLFFVPSDTIAQDDPMVVGFQFRPIFKNKFFNSGNTEVLVNDVNFTVVPRIGYGYGMVIRKPLAKKISFEGGINYLRRNYVFSVEDLDSSFSKSANFSIVEYEIPLCGMVHVRLGDKFYMNNSAGISLNMFKRSEVETTDNIEYYFTRGSWMNFAMVANVGWEYRTENSGYFYLGASYQLPINKTITILGEYSKNVGHEEFASDMDLAFFTVDIKYYFASRD